MMFGKQTLYSQQLDTARIGLCFVNKLVRSLLSESVELDELLGLPASLRVKIVTDHRKFLSELQQIMNVVQYLCDGVADQREARAGMHSWFKKVHKRFLIYFEISYLNKAQNMIQFKTQASKHSCFFFFLIFLHDIRFFLWTNNSTILTHAV